MAEIQFRFFGWCFNKASNNDKIWGWFTIGEKIYNFWGPRGSEKLIKIRFKEVKDYPRFLDNEYSIKNKTREKLKKGYTSVSITVEDDVLVDVEKIYPGFTDHLKKQMFIAKLSGKIMGAE
jgi:hypothetical protein